MTALPTASDFTGPTVTEGQAKTAWNDQRAFLAGLLGEDGLPATAMATLGAMISGYAQIEAAYAVTTSDRGKILFCSGGPYSVSLPPVATAGAGFALILYNPSTGTTVTVDPDGAETIDGAATKSLKYRDGALIFCNGASWSALDFKGAVVGTVSQSGGVPTGAVIERGSNANGSYVRFADGTQICTHAVTLAYSSTSRLTVNWTFAAAFAAAPVVTATPSAADLVANTAPGPGGVLAVLTGTVATTWTPLWLYRPTGGVDFAAGNTATVKVMAVGRWF